MGGNAIQFAMTSRKVVAVDMDAGRLEDAAHNARVYGVEERIDFVCDDFVHFATSYVGPPVDAVFLSPPWGGPEHLDAHHFSLKFVTCPDIVQLFAAAVRLSPRVTLYLPRHQDLNEIVLLAVRHGFPAVEIEKVLFQYPTPHLKLVVVYFGPEAATVGRFPAARSLQKTVGATGAALIQKEGPRKKEATEACCQLLVPAPLAGPVLRALYCRHHYVGRYVVALAMTMERQSRTLSTSSKAPCRTAAKASRRHALAATSASAATEVARALIATLASQQMDNDEELIRCIAWLLGEVPLVDLLHVVAMARAECSGRQDHAGTCLFKLLQWRLPEVHRRMLDWRKGVAAAAAQAGVY